MPAFRGIALAAGLLAASAIASPAFAIINNYDAVKFRTAQDAGQRVLVFFATNWDEASQAQRPVIETLSRDMHYPDVTFFRVDWTYQRDVAIQLHARQNATIIIYKGHQERARTVGDADEMQLRDMLSRAR